MSKKLWLKAQVSLRSRFYCYPKPGIRGYLIKEERTKIFSKDTKITIINCIDYQQTIESGYEKLKRLIKPTLDFKSMKTAYVTIKGGEIMRILKKRKFKCWKYGQGIQGEI